MTRAAIFALVKKTRGGRPFDGIEVGTLDLALDALEVPRDTAARRIGPKGIDLIKRFEGCELSAYPDPGTGGDPWTIGWGATGPGIKKGVIWTQGEADERLERDLQNYADDVAKAIGDAPTTQEQFDALVSFHYNTGAIGRATLTKLHKAGDYEGAGREFAKWVKAGGRTMLGLVRRRAAEAALYRGAA